MLGCAPEGEGTMPDPIPNLTPFPALLNTPATRGRSTKPIRPAPTGRMYFHPKTPPQSPRPLNYSSGHLKHAAPPEPQFRGPSPSLFILNPSSRPLKHAADRELQ